MSTQSRSRGSAVSASTPSFSSHLGQLETPRLLNLLERQQVKLNRLPRHPPPPPAWSVPPEVQEYLAQDDDLKPPKTDRDNTLSLYGGLKGRHATAMSLQATPRGGEEYVFNDNIEYKVEKDYIRRASLRGNGSRGALPKQLMYQYNKPALHSEPMSYRRPLPPVGSKAAPLSKVDAFFEELRRRPSAVLLFPKHQHHRRCGAGRCTCEVLGPAACALCIETTNKQLAQEIEEIVLPDVDVSSRALVAPHLAHLLVHENLKHLTMTPMTGRSSSRKDTLLKRISTLHTAKKERDEPQPAVTGKGRKPSIKPPLASYIKSGPIAVRWDRMIKVPASAREDSDIPFEELEVEGEPEAEMTMRMSSHVTSHATSHVTSQGDSRGTREMVEEEEASGGESGDRGEEGPAEETGEVNILKIETPPVAEEDAELAKEVSALEDF